MLGSLLSWGTTRMMSTAPRRKQWEWCRKAGLRQLVQRLGQRGFKTPFLRSGKVLHEIMGSHLRVKGKMVICFMFSSSSTFILINKAGFFKGHALWNGDRERDKSKAHTLEEYIVSPVRRLRFLQVDLAWLWFEKALSVDSGTRKRDKLTCFFCFFFKEIM